MLKTSPTPANTVSPYLAAAYLWLVLITGIALFSVGEPLLPLDPRTNTAVEGVHLSFPAWGSFFEPLTAPLHIVGFLPDYRQGVVSMFAWLLTCIFLFPIFRAKKTTGLVQAAARGFRAIMIALLLLALYSTYVLTTHFPNWSLVKDMDSIIAADLHSHSLLSHDGVISARDNLLLHKERGYDLVAFTDHVNPQGPSAVFLASGDGLPAADALAGIEIPVYYGAHFYFVVLGMSKDSPLPKGLAFYGGHELPLTPPSVYIRKPHTWSIEKFIETVHQHHGIIITVGYHINAADVYTLAEAGVDGFEFVNYGHRPLSAEVRQAMLDVQRTKRVALVASNDWHGWTGALNAWTLVTSDPRIKDSSPKEVLLEALRHRDVEHIIPVVAQAVHPMSLFETIVAPFTATFLYAKALSPWQLISWWLWIIVFSLLVKFKNYREISLAKLVVPVLILVAGLLKAFDGIAMLFFSTLPLPLSKLYSGTAYISIGAGIIMAAIALLLGYKWFFQRPCPYLGGKNRTEVTKE